MYKQSSWKLQENEYKKTFFCSKINRFHTLATIINKLLLIKRRNKKGVFFTHHRITQENKDKTKNNQVGLRS
jgi:hypothetical protein